MTLVLIYSFAAGLSMLVGGVLARYSPFPSKRSDGMILHGVTAFGGGALLAAIALVLVPEATKQLAAWQFALAFGGGAVAFMELDRRLQKQGGTGAQVVAMLSDFLPEAIALGAAFAHGDSTGPLLAMLIALQNVPEGFNAYRELESVMRAGKALLILFALAWLGPISAGVGYLVLVDYPAIVAYVMAFAAGGILYLIFQDIAPDAKQENHWVPPLGAAAGFLLGALGDYLVH